MRLWLLKWGDIMAEDLTVTVAGLRAWAEGSYPDEAAVELLARAFGGRFASTEWPWVRQCDRSRRYSLHPDAIWTGTSLLSGAERRLLNIVATLSGRQPLADLAGVLAGLDRYNLALVLAAFSHASGCHDRAVPIWRHGCGPIFERPGPLVDWPPEAEQLL